MVFFTFRYGLGMHVSTVVGNKGYDIEAIDSFHYFVHDLPIIVKVVNSFQIIKPFLEYENSTYGIKMQYPPGWSIEGNISNSSIVAFFYPQRDTASNVKVQIKNLTTSYTPDQFFNNLMNWYASDYVDFQDIKFNQNTTNNIFVAGHHGYLLNGTFRDPTSDALQRFTDIGTIIGDKVYSIIYNSPAETYADYSPIYLHMIKSFEVVPQKK
jgi:hypothetical protein